jgi:DNA-binding transcriptional ArsR family regulator
MVIPLIEILKALADERRLKILRMLLSTDLCVGALAKHLGISEPAVSQHLQILRKAGLVRGEKRGYWTHYIVDRPTLLRIAAQLGDLAATHNTYDTICRRIDESPKMQPQSKKTNMCRNCCGQPNKLKDRPGKYTPAQVRVRNSGRKEPLFTKKHRAPGSE